MLCIIWKSYSTPVFIKFEISIPPPNPYLEVLLMNLEFSINNIGLNSLTTAPALLSA